jgi:hypothetical protein
MSRVRSLEKEYIIRMVIRDIKARIQQGKRILYVAGDFGKTHLTWAELSILLF